MGLVLNIEDDLSSPALICLEELEAMEGDRFDVGASYVAIWIKFVSQGSYL